MGVDGSRNGGSLVAIAEERVEVEGGGPTAGSGGC